MKNVITLVLLSLGIMATGANAATEPRVDFKVCERGYIAEIIVPPANGTPQVFIRARSQGMKPVNANEGKVLINGEYYTVLRHSIENSKYLLDFEQKVAALQAAQLARTPIRFATTSPNCLVNSAQAEIKLCTAEADCNQ